MHLTDTGSKRDPACATFLPQKRWFHSLACFNILPGDCRTLHNLEIYFASKSMQFHCAKKTVSQFLFGKSRCIEGIWLCMIFWPGPRSTTYLPIWWQSFTLSWSLFSCKLKNSFSDMTLQVIFRFHLTVTIPWSSGAFQQNSVFFWNTPSERQPHLLSCPQSWKGFPAGDSLTSVWANFQQWKYIRNSNETSTVNHQI